MDKSCYRKLFIAMFILDFWAGLLTILSNSITDIDTDTFC